MLQRIGSTDLTSPVSDCNKFRDFHTPIEVELTMENLRDDVSDILEGEEKISRTIKTRVHVSVLVYVQSFATLYELQLIERMNPPSVI